MNRENVTPLPAQAYRLDRMPAYGFAVLSKRIAEMNAAGRNVIRLDIGAPDMPPPDAVIDALAESARSPKNHSYGAYTGDPGFRKAVAAYYKRRFGVELDPNKEVLPLIGSKEGIVNLALAYVDRGDAVLVPTIGYPAYRMGALMAGGEVIDLPLDPKTYLPNFDAVRDLIRQNTVKMMWLNYPNNPTGATADLAFYEQAAEFCREHHILLASDNPYAEVVYDGYKAPSALQAADAKDCTVEFISLSKMYNMAGWRLGACVGNAEAIDKLLQVKSNIDSGHFKPIYDAGSAALLHTPDEWIDQRNAVYGARRDKLLTVLPELGLQVFRTSASLYVWARVEDGDEEHYAESALTEAAVSITPGTMYGGAGRGYLRFSLGVEDHLLDEALTRLKDWYKKQ